VTSKLVAVSSLVIGVLLSADPARASSSGARVRYAWTVDVPIAVSGVALLVTGNAIHTDMVVVPPEGLDVDDIHWELDRRAVHDVDEHADPRSSTMRDVALTLPLVLGVAVAESGNRLHAGVDRIAMVTESLALAEGITNVLKSSVSRPRPFTYLDESQRPATPHYDVRAERAFQSMPSGHASTAWCSVGVLLTDPWLDQPSSSWIRRTSVGFVGSTVATATGGLRVEAGQHFTTDVVVGGLIGTACGIAVPLLHGYIEKGTRVAHPTTRGWLERAAGVAVGFGSGLLLTDLLGDR